MVLYPLRFLRVFTRCHAYLRVFENVCSISLQNKSIVARRYLMQLLSKLSKQFSSTNLLLKKLIIRKLPSIRNGTRIWLICLKRGVGKGTIIAFNLIGYI